jgi:hypothetical protein
MSFEERRLVFIFSESCHFDEREISKTGTVDNVEFSEMPCSSA